MKNRFVLLLTSWILLCFTINVKAQKRVADSLMQVLQNNQISTHQRAMTMARLSDALSFDNLPKSFTINHQAIIYALQHKDNAAASYSYGYRATLYLAAQKTDSAKIAVDSALFLAKNVTPFFKGIAWYRRGVEQNIDNHPEEALNSWQKALSYLDDVNGGLYKSSIYYLLYGIYAEREDTDKATNYAKLSLSQAEKSNDPGMLTAAWQINGSNFLQRFEVKKDTLLLDSAVHFFQQSVQVFKARKDWIKNQSIVTLSALNLADIYMDYFPPWYKDSILNNVNLALNISTTYNNKTMQANCYDIISKLSKREGNMDAAANALLKEKNIVDAINPTNYYLSMNLYQSLAQLEEQKGDDKKALSYYKQYLNFYHKEFDEQQYQTIQRLEAKYQNEKKDKALKLLEQRNQFQKKQTYLYIGIAIVAVLGLLFLFLAYHFRLRYSLQREKLKDEEAARLIAEQKLMQSQKEQLQKELLAGALQVEHKNEILLNLKDKLLKEGGSQSSKQLEKIINEEIRVDEDFENITEFENIHPDFFIRLQKKAEQKLTSLDLKYCAYLYMKLSPKQIAALLHVESKSVRMTKYRLKQKLGLGKEDDLDAFITSVN